MPDRLANGLLNYILRLRKPENMLLEEHTQLISFPSEGFSCECSRNSQEVRYKEKNIYILREGVSFMWLLIFSEAGGEIISLEIEEKQVLTSGFQMY